QPRGTQLFLLRRMVRTTAVPPTTSSPAPAARPVSSAPVRRRSDPPSPLPSPLPSSSLPSLLSSSSPPVPPSLPSLSATTSNGPVRASSSSVSVAPVTSTSYLPR